MTRLARFAVNGLLALSMAAAAQSIPQKPVLTDFCGAGSTVVQRYQAGSAVAAIELGVGCLKARGRNNAEQAFGLFQEASENGSLDAKAYLGQLYLTGRGVPQDVAQGQAFLEDAVKEDSAVGERFLALRLLKDHTRESTERAVFMIRRSSTAGDVPAMRLLAQMYDRGVVVKKNPQLAEALYLQCDQKGNTWCSLGLARIYARATDAVSSEKASAYLEKASKNGNWAADYELADRVLRGSPSISAEQNACNLLRRSALSGYYPASIRLGMVYASGEHCGKDKVEASAFYSLAIVQKPEIAQQLQPALKNIESSLSQSQRSQEREKASQYQEQAEDIQGIE